MFRCKLGTIPAHKAATFWVPGFTGQFITFWRYFFMTPLVRGLFRWAAFIGFVIAMLIGFYLLMAVMVGLTT